jgi:hypothetical protein
LYHRILSALQLATILEGARPFFMKVMFADIEPTPQGPVFGQLYSPTAAQMSNYYSSLSNIASSYGISIEGSTNMLNGKHLRPDPKPLFSATDPVVELGEALECYLLAGRSTFSEPRMTVPSRPVVVWVSLGYRGSHRTRQ